MAERIESILIRRLLHGKCWLDYLPAERGRRYRVFRAVVMRHLLLTGMIVAAMLGAVARWVMPLFVPDFWDQVSAGSFGHLVNFAAGAIVVGRALRWIDEQLYFDPNRFALAQFRKLAFPWLDAYDSIQIGDKASLDNHVITAQHARDVPDELTYGILVAKVADVLAESSDATSLKGLDRSTFFAMMVGQKLDNPEHQILMEQLFAADISAEALAVVVQGVQLKGVAGKPEVKQMLDFWVKWGTFQLRVDLPTPLQHVGSQLSRGYLDLRGDVGQNCLSYMGRHADGRDFPIAMIHGDAGDSLATSSKRGLIYCSGDVGDDCGKGMTGGTIVVGGRPGNRFGSGLDDTTHPAVLVAYRGIDGYLPEDTFRNGLVLLLNKDVPDPPMFMRFRDGSKEELLQDCATAGDLYETITEYVLEWRTEHDIPIPSELAGEQASRSGEQP